MTNNDRFWDSAIAEAVSGHQPPDQSAEILARLHAPEGSASARPRSLRRRLALHVLHAAGAAAVLCVIGLATGLVKWPWASTDPEVSQPVAELVAAPDATWRQEGDWVVLESGALLVSTGAPPVRRGESTLENVQGLALVQAGQEPTAEQKATLNQWLQTKGVEADMIRNATKWLQGTALCVLMLQGSATMDGQKVEAEKPAAEPVWHVVESAMDIDKLPEGVTHVDMRYQSCLLLEFLVERKSVKHLRLDWARDASEASLRVLTELPELSSLHMWGIRWTGKPALFLLEDLKALKEVAVDVTPSRLNSEGGYTRIYDEQEFQQDIYKLEDLAEKGVRIRLSEIDASQVPLGVVLDSLTGLDRLEVMSASDEDVRRIAMLKKLTTLTLRGKGPTHVGITYLARHSPISELDLTLDRGDLAGWYQLGKMTNLKSLRVSGVFAPNADAAECLQQLSGLKNLAKLELASLSGPRMPGSHEPALIPAGCVAKLPVVDELSLDPANFANPWQALPSIRCKRLLLRTNWRDRAGPPAEPVVSEPSEVETLVLYFTHGRHSAGDFSVTSEMANLVRVLPLFKKLKRIEVRIHSRVSDADLADFIDQLRKAAPKATVERTQ